MALRRFFVAPEFIREDVAHLPADQAHHLRDVLRIQAGEQVEIFDGAGNGYAGEVEFRGADVCACRLLRLSSPAPSTRLILAVALIKPAKFEWILEKATELGVDEILPLKTAFSEIRIPDDKMANRRQRWERIVEESSKQCRRLAIPRVHAPVGLERSLSVSAYASYARFFFYEKSSDPWCPETALMPDGAVLWIGPEGGWATHEVEAAAKAGCVITGLGPLILRAETAAIAAIAILQHHIHLSRQRAVGSRQ